MGCACRQFQGNGSQTVDERCRCSRMVVESTEIKEEYKESADVQGEKGEQNTDRDCCRQTTGAASTSNTASDFFSPSESHQGRSGYTGWHSWLPTGAFTTLTFLPSRCWDCEMQHQDQPSLNLGRAGRENFIACPIWMDQDLRPIIQICLLKLLKREADGGGIRLGATEAPSAPPRHVFRMIFPSDWVHTLGRHGGKSSRNPGSLSALKSSSLRAQAPEMHLATHTSGYSQQKARRGRWSTVILLLDEYGEV